MSSQDESEYLQNASKCSLKTFHTTFTTFKIIIFLITALTAIFSLEPKVENRYLGYTGVLTCKYAPPNARYISVEWKYSTTESDWNTANRVYSYLSPGINGTSAGHLGVITHMNPNK